MPYRFKRGDDSVEHGVRRIAIEQLDKAIDEIDDGDLSPGMRVHQVRKRCKKVRALLRLVRPSFADYAAENATLRDAADRVAFARDAGVLITTYDNLMDAFRDEVARADFATIRRQLTLRHKQDAGAGRMEDALAQVRAGLDAARGRARHWRVAEDGFAAIGPGLARAYKRSRKAMARAAADGDAQTFHEWRKRVKDHGSHARLLAPIWPEPMQARAKAAGRLSDLLGAHHDLAVFEAALAAGRDAFGAPEAVEAAIVLSRRRQAALAGEAFPLGERLLVEPKRALRGRWRAYWDIWRNAPSKAAQAA